MSRQRIIKIMKVSIFTLSLLALLVSSCGRPPIRIVDAELQEYVSRFEQIGRFQIGDLEAQFGEIKEENVVGLCETDDDAQTPPKITISKEYWEGIIDVQREELLFHELGHCILNREHRNDLGADGCPMSIMYWETISVQCLDRYIDYYREELFGRE